MSGRAFGRRKAPGGSALHKQFQTSQAVLQLYDDYFSVETRLESRRALGQEQSVRCGAGARQGTWPRKVAGLLLPMAFCTVLWVKPGSWRG